MATHIFKELPSVGAWRLRGAYDGTEVVRFTKGKDRFVIDGTTVGLEAGVPWSIHYKIALDAAWHVREATITDYAGKTLDIQVDQAASWTVNGELHTELQGCWDLDFEASVVTNTIPIHRLALQPGGSGESEAVYIRTIGLAVERLNQTYLRLPDENDTLRFDYQSPRFGYHDILRFGSDGLAVDYPAIGQRLQ